MLVMPYGGCVPTAASAPGPAFNASAETTTASTTNHDVTLNLASGTNRLVLITATWQQAGLNFTSAVFDQGGGNQAAMTLVAEAIAGAPNTQAMYYYLVPDGVSAGNKTIRTVSDISGSALVFAVAYSNIGGGPASVQIAQTDFNPNLVTTTVIVTNSNDLVVSVLGTDEVNVGFTPGGGLAMRHDLSGGTNGVSSIFADDLTTMPGSLNVTWSRNAGAATVVDAAVVTAVFPHL
jgi:hypothetical protein